MPSTALLTAVIALSSVHGSCNRPVGPAAPLIYLHQVALLCVSVCVEGKYHTHYVCTNSVCVSFVSLTDKQPKLGNFSILSCLLPTRI